MSVSVSVPHDVFNKERMSLTLAVPSHVGRSAAARSPSPASRVLRCHDCLSTRTASPARPASVPASSPVAAATAAASNPRAISSAELAGRLRQHTAGFLLIDCRSFVAFNIGHISGSLNVSCADRCSKRRLAGGRVSIGDIVSGQVNAKETFKAMAPSADLILYDDNSEGPDHLNPASVLPLVLSTLTKEGRKPIVLKGGIKEFQPRYEDLCERRCIDVPSPIYSPTNQTANATVEPSIIETMTASQILPYLYLGSERDASNLTLLKEKGITHILNATELLPLHFEGQFIYKRLPATDCAKQNLSQYFKEAFDFIEESRTSGGRVLIHCHAGVSRSATLTISYIMRCSSIISMVDTYRAVKSKRSIIAPNFNFMGQLLEFEKCLKEGTQERCLRSPLPFERCV